MGSTPALAPVFPGTDNPHSGAFDRTDFAGNWGGSADKASLFADTQAMLVALTVFEIAFVEDHRLGSGSLLNYSGRSGTLLRNSPVSTLQEPQVERYWIRGANSVSFEIISVV